MYVKIYTDKPFVLSRLFTEFSDMLLYILQVLLLVGRREAIQDALFLFCCRDKGCEFIHQRRKPVRERLTPQYQAVALIREVAGRKRADVLRKLLFYSVKKQENMLHLEYNTSKSFSDQYKASSFLLFKSLLWYPKNRTEHLISADKE